MPKQRHKSFPAWQVERAKFYQRACLTIKAAIHCGDPVGRSIRRIAWRYAGRRFKSDSSRRLAMSPKSLRRFWDAWNQGGEQPAAFALHYRPHRRFIPAPVLVRFAEFCASHPRRSVAAAWKAFRAHDGRAGKSLNMSDFLLRKYFPVASFYLMQAELKAIAAAQTRLAQFKLAALVEIRRRLANYPRRRRGEGKLN